MNLNRGMCETFKQEPTLTYCSTEKSSPRGLYGPRIDDTKHVVAYLKLYNVRKGINIDLEM